MECPIDVLPDELLGLCVSPDVKWVDTVGRLVCRRWARLSRTHWGTVMPWYFNQPRKVVRILKRHGDRLFCATMSITALQQCPKALSLPALRLLSLDAVTAEPIAFKNILGGYLVTGDSQISSLSINYPGVRQMEVLRLPWLESLTLCNADACGTKMPLHLFGQLRALRLQLCYLNSLECCSGLTQLEYLDLQSNRFTDITPLSTCTALEYLNLSCNHITSSAAPLAGCTRLRELDLYYVQGDFGSSARHELGHLIKDGLLLTASASHAWVSAAPQPAFVYPPNTRTLSG